MVGTPFSVPLPWGGEYHPPFRSSITIIITIIIIIITIIIIIISSSSSRFAPTVPSPLPNALVDGILREVQQHLI